MSFCITAIWNDGIIIATESRWNIFEIEDWVNIPIAYYDTIQKTFTDWKIWIWSTWKWIIWWINWIFFSKIIKDYFSRNLISHKWWEIDSFIKYTQNFLHTNLSEEILTWQVLLLGTFIQTRPIIGYMDYRLYSEENPIFYWITNKSYLTSDNSCIFWESYSPDKSCLEIAKIATEAIEEYSKRWTNFKTIWWPISILKITENWTEWIQNPPIEQKYFYFSDFIDWYKNQEIDLKILENYDKKHLDELLWIKD